MSPYIAFFLPDLRAGGAENVIIAVAEETHRRGYEVDLVVGDLTGELIRSVPEGIHIVDLGCYSNIKLKPLFAIQTIMRLSRYLRIRQPNCVLSTLTGANLAAVVARGLTRHTTTSLVLREASSYHNIHSLFRKQMMRWLYPQADACIAVSNGIANDLENEFGLNRKTIYLIHNPIDQKKIAQLAAIETDHILPHHRSKYLIVAAGRLRSEKGFEYLIREFQSISGLIDANLLILGEGSERKALETLIEELGIASRVDLPGYLDNPFPLIAYANLFVLSSKWEGFPNVLLESLTLGIPVVATDCHSGPAEILNGGEYGSLVPYGKPGALAEAMLRTLLQPTASSILKARASQYSISRIVDQYQTLFDKLIDNNKAQEPLTDSTDGGS